MKLSRRVLANALDKHICRGARSAELGSTCGPCPHCHYRHVLLHGQPSLRPQGYDRAVECVRCGAIWTLSDHVAPVATRPVNYVVAMVAP